jgi:hypothetical protein
MPISAENPLPYPINSDAYAPESPGKTTAVDQVLDYFRRDNPWDYDYKTLRDLQFEAFNERLAQRVEEIPVLRQRSEQLGIQAAGSLDDVLPLLFSPTVYKSYPDSFVTKGRWDNLLRWLDGVSTVRLKDEVQLDGVADIDDFIDRVRAAGHNIVTTSGTSGKASLLPESALDVARRCEVWPRTFGTMLGIDPTTGPHPIFYTGHRRGAYGGQVFIDVMSEAFSTPQTTYALFEERLRVADVGRMAALSQGLASGSATPSEIAEVRANQETVAAHAAQAVDRFVDLLEAHRDEPVYLWGQTFAFWTVMQRAKERGADVRFHPAGGVITAGGLKNNRLPDGYQDDLRSFYNVRMTSGYGQSEVMGVYLECSEGRWHLPPTILLILTDPSGEKYLDVTEGVAEGVASCFDFSPVGRWGGLISSDWVTADFSPCPCGLRSPSLLGCRRVNNRAGEEDKLNCQGRVEMYIRGILDDPTP